ncbi:MAG: glycoside hydrolase family 3 N-terminal domain-containing protein [Saonia sp.]
MNKVLPYEEAKNVLDPKEKVGQLFMPAAFINDTEEEIQQLESLIKDYGVGGLCFFHSRASAATNFEGKKEVILNENSLETLKKLILRYQNVSKYPLLISMDAEWGLAMRIENTPQYPYAITLGALEGHTDLIFEVGKNIARDCKLAGIHWNLAPVVDINTNPLNPVIGYRSFGEHKEQVVQKASAFIKGTQSEGILTSIKHFPGHGDTATDSHLGLPVIHKTKQELLDNELYPFRKLLATQVDSVMIGHLAVPSLTNGIPVPATLSKAVIQNLLREEMGFKGVVISDALNMHSVSKMYPVKGALEWQAFDAGNDVLCFAEHIAEGIGTILKKASENQIEERFENVWRLKKKAIHPPLASLEELSRPDALNSLLAENSLTFLKGTENDLLTFKKTDFIGVAMGKKMENVFFRSIAKELRFDVLSAREEIKNNDNMLLALFPPQVKPTASFGIPDKELQRINELIKTRNSILYLFGNPYVLNHINIENARAVVLVYQDFGVFQENAAQHFLGHTRAKGKLSIAINTIDHEK